VYEESITLENFILVLPPLLGYEEAPNLFCLRLQFVDFFYTVTLVIKINITFVIITANHSL